MNKILSGKRVLVVEDEMMVLMNIEGALSDLGCDVIRAAATVDEAHALLGSERFDLAVLDVNLNGHRSYDVADALALLSIPFAFSTGYRDVVGAETRFRGRPVLTKPYSDRDLAAVIVELLPATSRLAT